VVECRAVPAICGVAGFAVLAELAVVMILGSMARITTCGCTLIDTVGMAGGTRQVVVPAGQREAGVVVIESCATPTVRGVTGTTILAKLAVMVIVGGMAGKAVGRQAGELSVRVAGRTGSTGMLARQWESGGAVVEIDDLPATGDMAGSAIRAKTPAVDIPGSVTGITVPGRATVDSVGMARLAGNRSVQTGQDKTTAAMIEGHFLPTAGDVAIRAGGPELAAMRFILLVAGETIHRGTAVPARMTILAS